MLFRSYARIAAAFCAALLTSIAIACGGSRTTPTGSTLKVLSVSPSAGSTGGGTMVTLTGSEFGADASVMIAGVPATQITFIGPTTLTAVAGSRPTPGAGDVVVTSGGKSATLPNAFTYVAASGSNRPPVIGGITASMPRPGQPVSFGNISDAVTLTAGVTDNETPSDRLTFEWSGPGSFSGTAATTTWTLPAATASPGPITATLKAIETFTEGGVTHRNESAAASYTLTLHDTTKEVGDLGDDFLTLFSQSNIPTDTVLRGFSATCDDGTGRAMEKDDVDRAHRDYQQDFSKFRISRLPVTINFGGSCTVPAHSPQRHVDACVSYNVHWEISYIRNVDADRRVGTKETTDGVDYVSAVLESNQWRLCHSGFVGVSRIGLLPPRAVSW